jgi:hypothetical protein
MAKLFHSLKETVRSKLTQPARGERPSRKDKTSVGRATEKEAEQAPPERVGEVVGHSSAG